MNKAPVEEPIADDKKVKHPAWLVFFTELSNVLLGKVQSLVKAAYATDADTVDGYEAAALLNPTTQRDVTAERAYGSVYQNDTGKPMFVCVKGRNNTVGAGMVGYTDSNNPPTEQVSAFSTPNTNYSTTLYLWVMPDNYYKAAAASGTPTLDKWTEWY